MEKRWKFLGRNSSRSDVTPFTHNTVGTAGGRWSSTFRGLSKEGSKFASSSSFACDYTRRLDTLRTHAPLSLNHNTRAGFKNTHQRGSYYWPRGYILYRTKQQHFSEHTSFCMHNFSMKIREENTADCSRHFLELGGLRKNGN